MKEIKNVLIIGYVWPEPKSSAAGRRMMQLISLFESRGWEIIFASSAAESKHMADLKGRGITTASIAVNSSEFDKFVKEINPSVVLFDRFITEEQFGWRVAEACPNAVRILDTEDLHCLRRARKKAVQEGRSFKKEDLLKEKTAKREIAGMYRCDLSLVISEFEMNLLTDFFEIDANLLQYLPFMVDEIDQQSIEKWRSFDERKHFVTIGNFRHPPNWDSVLYLKAEVWPLIREQMPEAELHIYGAYVSQKAKQLHNPQEGFFIEGRAANARAVVGQARVLLAPLRFGAGLKGKLVEAMQCGTPSVTTPAGAEGINGNLDWSGFIADPPRDIADRAVRLYRNKLEWEKAQKRGITVINSRFANTEQGRKFLKNVDRIRAELTSHRRSNFVGQMLQHHTAASTKYMSRWIEAKNRD